MQLGEADRRRGGEASLLLLVVKEVEEVEVVFQRCGRESPGTS